jgi:hypothetical protein
MSPWKEDQKQLVSHILVGNIEVMLERRQVNISVDLIQMISISLCLEGTQTDILLHVFCSMLQSCLANLKSHLRRGVIYEPAIGTKRVRPSLRSLSRVWVSITLLLWWLGGRRRRSQLRNGRYMLRDGVVERRRCGRGRISIGAPLHLCKGKYGLLLRCCVLKEACTQERR